MSKYVASETNGGHESHTTGRKRGAGNEENEDGEEIVEPILVDNATTWTAVSAAPAAVDQCIHAPDFKKLLVGFVQGDTLTALRFTTKAWKAVAEEVVNVGVSSGKIFVHDGRDISLVIVNAQEERRALATRVIFLLNITKVGENACMWAVNLVVVDIPEGVKSIGYCAFDACRSLTTASFPMTLTSIGECAFRNCTSLDNVDLLHTNLQYLGLHAFDGCSELKSMMIPDSL